MRSETATAGRVRLVIVLSVASAVTIMLGAILVVVSTAVHLVQGHPAGRVTSLGAALSAAGLAVGLVTLLAFAFSRVGRSRSPGRSRPAPDALAARPPASQRKHAANSGARQRRPQVLSPTTVYSPGGLLDVPRDARAPGFAGPPGTGGFQGGSTPPPPQGARETPGTPTSGGIPNRVRNGDRPPPDRVAPPYPPYQPGARPAGRGWVPGAQAGYQPRQSPPPQQQPPPPLPPPQQQPPPPLPPSRERVRPREAVPPRAAPPSRAAPPPRGAPSPREGPPPGGAAMPRETIQPGGPWPPGEPWPPRERTYPVHPANPGSSNAGQASASAKPPGGPGHVTPGGRPPTGSPSLPGAPASPGSRGTFDGGYAPVIRAADYPVPPPSRIRPGHPARPAGPAPSADRGWPADPGSRTDADVYVYRETGGQPDDPAAGSPARDPGERDAAYWYDLLAEDPAPKREETRGPFEPLVSSTGPPPDAAHQQPAAPDAMGPAGSTPDQAPADAVRDRDLDESADARARKLERIKDFYLTAEAIGEQNVDKYFDQLLAQQRELISDYFRPPAVTSPRGGPAADAGAEARGPGDPGVAGGQPGAPEGAGVAAEPPRAW